jgi:AraC family transcriptional regulator
MASRTEKASCNSAADHEVGQGVLTYSTVLQTAGGEQVKALMRDGHDRVVCAALYTAPPYALRVPGMDVSRLSLNLTPACVTGGIEGERPRSFDTHRYSLFMAPAGAEMNWRKESSSRHLTIYFRPDLFDGGEESATPLAMRQALHNLSVPGVRPLADQLVHELRRGGPCDPEAADCMARLLLIQVSRHLRKAQDGTEALSTSSMKRLNDYVLAHLGERILVADLARQVGMSIDRFAWTCKRQTGQSPHQYVLALRLQQARHLLRHSPVAVAEVASACGFSNQQHLTNAMQRHAGVTPARYRKETVSGERSHTV